MPGLRDKTSILYISVRADFGGGPEHLFRLVNGLSDKYKTFIACPNDYPYYEKYSKIIGKQNLVEIPHRKFGISSFIKLIKFVKKKKVKIIHSMGKGAGIYGRLLAIVCFKKCVHTFHGLHIDNYNSIQKKLYLALEKILSVFSTMLIAVSNSEYDRILKHNICKKDSITVIDNGVIIPEKFVTENNFNKDKFVVTTITRLDYAKNPNLLIDIFQSLVKLGDMGKYELQIIGLKKEVTEDGEFEIPEKLKKNIRLLGFTLNPSVHLLESSCYLSTSRWEGLPLSVIEAMSVGLPVIATNVVGNNSLVENNSNGFLYDINAPEEAAKKIIQLSGDLDLWKKFSAINRKLVEENYSITKMVKETENLYVNILD